MTRKHTSNADSPAARRRSRRGASAQHPERAEPLDGRSRLGAGDGELNREKDADDLFDLMLTLVQSHNALDLRIARLCSWIKTRDPAELGYSSHSALFKQHVTWSSSRLRELIRLVESDLHDIKRAVCLGLVPISAAAKAVGKIDADQQEWWLEGMRRGEKDLLPPPKRRRAPVPRVVKTVDLEGDELREIHAARQLARLVVGQPLPDDVVDCFIIESWRRGVDGREMVRRARQAPPAPPKRSPPGWCDVQDPATRLLGHWVEPRDLAHALRLLERAQVARDSRVVLIGQAYDRMALRKLYWHLGYHSLEAMAREGLELAVRTLERYRELAWQLEHLPQLRQAIDQGLDLARARLLADVACEESIDDWLVVARNTGVAELERAVKLASRDGTKKVQRGVLDSYHHAIELAQRVVRDELEKDATKTGNATSGLGTDTTETGIGLDGIRIYVSLNAAWAPAPPPRSDRVHVDLPAAAAWFLENVRIEPQRGIGKVKERADYTCRNPECGCRNLRVQVHHTVWRIHGGTDDEWNLLAVCKPCHLRLIHPGIISVTRVGEALVWRYPGRIVVAL